VIDNLGYRKFYFFFFIDVQRGGGAGPEAHGAQERARHRIQDLLGTRFFVGFQMSSLLS